ncbi:recombinase RecT [Streptococcus anginosus]|uniref:recombinase RecT n=1 Tax=Streptococcus TaxID=1301 RepID=UPI0008A871DB|nr:MULTISPECIES: RecT family recombinase [Streptococcus]KAA9263539.1 recombinase RecT [Streptococcus anginosus]MCW0972189.1 recombinase RecT [Streptococcus anginosus]MCW1021079.1 recombinase RecT [Streptococcus anginosus]MCW1030627.1 recombinase RecT [Streptococcus anginosus]MCW1038959.1 recombinase RecT [Streptococcus anginosus]
MANELTQKQVTSNVANRIEAMKGEGLLIAPNYSVSNALSSAYYALKNSSSGNLLQQCTQDSVYNALLEMVTQGLSPAKKQCYFIKYGSDVQLRMSYFGAIKVTKGLQDVKDVIANVVYEGDTLEVAVENGRKKLVKHETDWRNADNPIISAYCIITRTDGEEFLEVMTKKQIDKSWSKAKTTNVQIDFPDQMAMRTVINRAAKMFINTSNDSDLFAGAINNTIADEYEDGRQTKDVTPQETESLDDVLGNPTVSESESVENPQETAEEPKNKVAVSKTETTTPKVNEETGEILDGEQGELFKELEDLM